MGSAATLSDPTAAIQTFVSDVAGDYVLQLIVNDGMDDSTPDSVVITVALPGANQPPVANAGLDKTVSLGATVAVNGSGSTDPDADQLTYSWSITSVPAGSGATLSDATAVNPTFVADVAGDYVLQLIANDGQFDSAPDTVMIRAQVVMFQQLIRSSGGGAISLTFLWMLGLAVFLTRRRSIRLQRSAGETSGS